MPSHFTDEQASETELRILALDHAVKIALLGPSSKPETIVASAQVFLDFLAATSEED